MALDATGAEGKDKRRHARHVASQAARLRFGQSSVTVAAEIRDFCDTGLYAAFVGEVMPDAALPVLTGSAVRVEFTVPGAGTFRCEGRVARMASDGVGVFVATMPAGALHALIAGGGAVVSSGPAAAPGPREAEALLQTCLDQLRQFIDATIEDFIPKAVERLHVAAQDEPTFLERARYEHTAQTLQQQRSQVGNALYRIMREHVRHPDAPLKIPAARRLALVEEDEFEDWLNLSAVIKQIEENIVALLHDFEQGYNCLVGSPVDRKSNPFGLEAIGRGFQRVLQEYDASNAIRAVLYKVLGQAIATHAPDFYQQLALTLEHLRSDKPNRPSRTRATDTAPATGAALAQSRLDLTEIAHTLNTLSRENPAAAPAAENAEYSLDRILASLNASQRGAGMPPVAVRPMQATVDGLGAARPEVMNVLGQLQLAARLLAGGQSAMAGISGAQPQAGLHDLLRALDSVSLERRAGEAPSLADLVDARIAAATGLGGGQLAPGYRQALDNVTALFGRARTDITPGSDMAELMRRLERPLLKLALQDPRFPADPDHPARQMLDLIEQYAVAADDKGQIFDAKLHRFLSLLVDKVCERAEDDFGIFDVVRDSLERVLQPILQIRRTRVARMQEASEGRERIRAARMRVNAALEARLAGREVPSLLLRLLDLGWRQYLVLLDIRQGPNSEALRTGLAVLDRLLDELGPAPAGALRVTESQAMLGEVERALATVNVDTGVLDAFMGELGARLVDDAARAAARPVMVRVPPGRSAEEEAQVQRTHRQLADRLRVGDWWDFAGDGGRVPMQLIWSSQPPYGCAFANRSATSKTELTLDELAQRMARGLATPGADLDDPLIQRSEQALFDDSFRQLLQQALRDPVTQLPNRKGFMQQLERLTLPEHLDKVHTVGVIEFDQFRMIVNSCGMEAAETLSRSLADAVRDQLGPDVLMAAFSNDTLAILLPHALHPQGSRIVDDLLARMKDYPFAHEQHSYSIGLNIGVSEFAPARLSPAEAVRRADSACITAKAQGRNRIQAYETESVELQTEESLMGWAGKLDTMLKDGGLHLRCQRVQPISADAGMQPYYEVLLGIEGKDGVRVLPSHFINAVERLQRAHEVDIWVMRAVFEWIAVHRAQLAAVGGFSINLSASSLSHPEVLHFLQDALADGDFPAHRILFEITETVAIESYGAAQEFMREMRRHGFRFSLDDFGSGFTSYAHLKNLHTDVLKIDGSFVRDMLQNPGDRAMVKSMSDIGHSLGMHTVAEYVESQTVLEVLREIGVDYVQGYAIHVPCAIDDILSQPA